MINYSSINDAWGKKEIYKKNVSIENNNSVSNTVSNTVSNKIEIPNISKKKDIFVETPAVEHFQSCSTMEHITNCPECKNKIMELFKQHNKKSKTINILGYKFKISKTTLNILFILIIICIILVVISIIQEKTNIFTDQCNKNLVSNKYMHMPYQYYNYHNMY